VAALASLESMIQEAKAVGADPSEALKLVDQARQALDRGEYVLASELLHRAESAVVQAQGTQVDRALDIRERQMEKVRSAIRRIKPIMAEAQTYGLDIELARSLAKEALAMMKQGDPMRALLLVKQAAEAIRALQPAILQERAQRGITTPSSGSCSRCASTDLEFQDDGWGRCRACGLEFRWRSLGPHAILSRLKRPIYP
jgi:phage shock protein A